MLGSVFSPYYAWAGRRDPLDHVALNVALYGPRGNRWAMTERRREALDRSPRRLVLGPSELAWQGDRLTFRVDEVAAPIPRRIRGRVRVHPTAVVGRRFALDGAGERHRWWPIAPLCRVEVELERPALAWQGHGYFDINAGDEPLEAGFRRWDWSRTELSANGGPAAAGILYDVWRRDGSTGSMALKIAADGGIDELAPPPAVHLPRSRWRIDRRTRSTAEHPARVVETLEDTPFYARSLVAGGFDGQAVTAVHETLDLDRFARREVRWMLPVRNPRTLR